MENRDQVFPSKSREAIDIPVLKIGKNPSNKNSYRQISLTNCLCKLMERMVNKRLSWYLEINNILHPCQSRFRRNKNTLDNQAILHSHIMEAFACRKSHMTVYMGI